MNPTRIPVILSLVLAVAGCHSSHSQLDGQADAAPDTPADPVPDAVPDAPADSIEDTTPPPPSGYALHEWGVMVMGPDGGTFHGSGPEYAGPIPAKPVIYLYADEAFSLDVAVHFSSGASTETWPEVSPGSTVTWSGLAVAPGPCAATPFPSPYDDPYYEGFCEACTLSLVVVPDSACVTHGGQVASLLFYTGVLPGYEAPLEVESYTYTGGDGSEQVAFTVDNGSTRPVEGVWLVYRRTEDACIDPSACPLVSADIAWSFLEAVHPGESLSLSLPVEHLETEVDEHGWPTEPLDLPAGWNDLGEDLSIALEARGLTVHEAGAFMNAWDGVFFGLMGSDSVYLEPLYREGSQVVYFMSREDYDAHLRLETSAPADEVVRVGMVYETL